MNSLYSLCLLLLLILPIHAWGPLGHSAIAAIAQKHLSPATQSHIAALLTQGHDTDLASIANWADEVRAAASGRGPLKDDPEAAAFNAKFPTNALWHFVDLPLGTEDYRKVAAFTPVNDVVHAIKRCVAVLEMAEPRPDDFTKPQALRLLVHFAGDIHQPLHCGTGFYDLSDLGHPALITDPRLCIGKPNDRGGNDLFFGPDSTQELHALWDDSLVFAIRNSADYRSLADFLESIQSVGSTTGDYHTWPEQWAIDSVQQARKAYRDIKLEAARTDGQRLRITVQLPTSYVDENRSLAATQLAKAGMHLAQLLNSLAWR
ncbi:MAG: S1/P1 nuclease [Verrucomicrobia bacterium]|nr:S1/P1 nuclease [Verrucomicrobiota bacterium]